MTCSNCGFLNDPDAEFCENCGRRRVDQIAPARAKATLIQIGRARRSCRYCPSKQFEVNTPELVA